MNGCNDRSSINRIGIESFGGLFLFLIGKKGSGIRHGGDEDDDCRCCGIVEMERMVTQVVE